MTTPDEDGSAVLFLRAPAGLARRSLADFASLIQNSVTSGRPFTCLVTDDRELLRLNRMFLDRNYPADVLSFPSGDESGSLGDIAISAGRAVAQAAEYGHGVDDEIRILMLHGALHLIGMDHEADSGRMARAEARWRKKFGLPAGLIARVRK